MMNGRMNRRMLMVLGVVLGVPFFSGMAASPGKYFTTANIWYEKPEKIYSTNYHVGRIIPAGTAVDVVSVSRGRIRFKDKNTGAEYVLHHVKKHSSISLDEFFKRYFSAENKLADASKVFSALENENIKTGSVANEMSRDAVLAAYGFPPSHKTPNLDDNIWVYWVNRFRTRQITFSDGKVVAIQ